mgnify:FL=1
MKEKTTDEIEELDDEYAEVEPDVSFDLSWKCKECGSENVEYNIPIEERIICTCEKCNKQYEYYYEPY